MSLLAKFASGDNVARTSDTERGEVRAIPKSGKQKRRTDF